MRGVESNVASLQKQTARQIEALTTTDEQNQKANNQTVDGIEERLDGLVDVETEVEEMQETIDQHGVDISNLETTKDELQTKVKLHCTVLKQKC